MKKILILVGALLTAGTAHAQGSLSSGGGINSVNGITSYRIASMRCDSAVDPRSTVVTTAKNDGPFMPSTFASYDEAVEIGQLAANAKPPRLGEIARSNREQKKSAGQSAILIVEQDQYGRMIAKSQPN
ncbi:MAG TPA: hypothetical protein VEX69_06960 [Candidatus Limnocylindria bacterium]|nr:hypothetical protein [Candidatus Limnocylindria bacterium]